MKKKTIFAAILVLFVCGAAGAQTGGASSKEAQALLAKGKKG